MLNRLFVLVVTTLYYIQASSAQKNGSNSISNLVSNGSQSQGNIIQKTLNQISNNRMLPINLQQTLNSQQGNLQTSITSQPSSNLQNANTLQAALQKSNTQPFLNPQQTGQSLLLQQQQKALQQVALQNANNIQANIQQQNSNMGNMHLLKQQIPGISSSQLIQNGHISSPQIYQEIPTNLLSNQAHITPGTSTINSGSNALINSGFNTGIHSLGDSTILYPQNPQVAVSDIPSYVIERSQMLSGVQALQGVPEIAGLNNQPIILGATHNGQPTLDFGQAPLINVQNPSELSNQITIIRSVQPQSTMIGFPNQPPISEQMNNQVAMVSPPVPQSPPPSYPAVMSNSAALSFPKQGTKSSNLKALLPLIINLIKERNSCGCPHHCGCGNTPRKQHEGGNALNGYPKQKSYGSRQEGSRRDDYDQNDDRNRFNSRRSSKKHGKRKNSEESYEEYDYKDEFDD